MPPMTLKPAADLEAAAQEELERACTLSWSQLCACTPWGDVFEGFSPEGRAVQFERSYLWVDEPGGDILCEVVVFEGAGGYEAGARVCRWIRRPPPQ
jgi:hypothetical protein